MNECPCCEKLIDYLVVRKMRGKVYIMKANDKILLPNMVENEDGIAVEDEKIFITHYSCPECEYTIYEDDEISAREWLEKI